MRDCRLAVACFFLLPLLPACSLISAQQEGLKGFPPDVIQQVRQQSDELHQLAKLDTATTAQQQQIKQLRNELLQFERDVISTAGRLEQEEDWQRAEKILQAATRALPGSRAIATASLQLSKRRQVHEERVRMELEIHRGEQLLKDADAYFRLQQLQSPGLLTWLELKSHNRERRASAKALQQHAQRAMNRKDFALAQQGLQLSQRLYGEELQQDMELRAKLERDLAVVNRKLRPINPQPDQAPRIQDSQIKDERLPISELRQALESGELLKAREYLNRLQLQSPQHPQLLPLQSLLHTLLNVRVETAINRGNELYSQGNIERALAVWREAKTLAPENVELQANIARAEKVLENLRALTAPPSATP